jgi:lipopolysaccharide transport system permease protein
MANADPMVMVAGKVRSLDQVSHRLLQLQGRSVFSQIRYAWHMRRVWWFTATARTKARFVRTKLGSLWLGLTNLLSVAVLATVYGTVFNVQDIQHYAVYLGVGMVLWTALSGAISSAPNLFEHSRENINNINIPPIFYALEEWAFQLQTFGQSLLMVALGLSIFEPQLIPNLFLFGIPGLLNLIVFMFWLPLIVCLLGVRYKDLYQLVPIVLQLVFLLSPILYTKKSLGEYSWIATFNPLYQSFGPLRDSMISGHFNLQFNALFFVANLVGLYLGLRLLRRDAKVLPFLL